jgi:hypothetical protein
MIKAHGGSQNVVLGGILKDTQMNTPRDVKEKHLDRLIAQTTGLPREKPIMDGIIASTIPKHMKDVPGFNVVTLQTNHRHEIVDHILEVYKDIRG